MFLEIENITAVILAGGTGTRLRSIIGENQKVLAHVNNIPFITYLLKQIASFGIKKTVLCTGYKSDLVRNEIKTTSFGLQILYSDEDKPMGTGGAVRLALPQINSEYLLIMNGDSYIEYDFGKFIDWYNKSKVSSAGVLLTEVANVSRYGRVITDNNDVITLFEEKGKFAGRGYINAGVYLMRNNFLHCIPCETNYSLEKELFPKLAFECRLLGYKVLGRFIDIGTPESYKQAGLFFKRE